MPISVIIIKSEKIHVNKMLAKFENKNQLSLTNNRRMPVELLQRNVLIISWDFQITTRTWYLANNKN